MKHSVPCTHEPCAQQPMKTASICRAVRPVRPQRGCARGPVRRAPGARRLRQSAGSAARSVRMRPGSHALGTGATAPITVARRHVCAPCQGRRPACSCSPPWRRRRTARRSRCTCCARRQRSLRLMFCALGSRTPPAQRGRLRRRVPRRSAAPRAGAALAARRALRSACALQRARSRCHSGAGGRRARAHQRFVPFGSAVMSSRPVFH